MPFDPELHKLPLSEYRPRPALRAPSTQVRRSRFPAIDAYNHLGRWLGEGGAWTTPDVGELLDVMDACNVTAMVNLDGRPGAELSQNLERYDRSYPGRFVTFCHPDWAELSSDGFGERIAAGIRRAVNEGARGVKVWKDLGLHLCDPRGALLMPDDSRLAPLWETIADLHVPVILHSADPVAFFEPIGPFNERLEELLEHPDWWFGERERFPSFDRIIESVEALVAAHPRTTFIGAHVGCFAESLRWIDRMLSAYHNFNVDIAARIAELGRQPRATRRLIVEHPDRVLFGTDDFPPNAGSYRVHFRFLESEDEHFPYSIEDPPPQGRWAISGLGLPDDALQSVYSRNALRLVPGLSGAS